MPCWLGWRNLTTEMRAVADPGRESTQTRDELERHLTEDLLAVRRAEEQSRRIAATLEKSDRVSRSALPRLRKAGLVR